MTKVTKELYDQFLGFLDMSKVATYRTHLQEIRQCPTDCEGCVSPFGAKLDDEKVYPIDVVIIDELPRRLLDHEIDLTVTKKKNGTHLAVAVYDITKNLYYLNDVAVESVLNQLKNKS